MTRTELMQVLIDLNSELAYKDIEAAVKELFQCLVNNLIKAERVEIRGFGSFECHKREPRTARNPRTGSQIAKSWTYSIHFKPGKELKQRVDELKDRYPITG